MELIKGTSLLRVQFNILSEGASRILADCRKGQTDISWSIQQSLSGSEIFIFTFMGLTTCS